MADDTLQFQQLIKRMSQLGFREWEAIVEEEVIRGVVFPYAQFYRHVLFAHPRATKALMKKHEWFVVESKDENVCAAVMKLLRQEWSYKPPITEVQFNRNLFGRHKMGMSLDFIALISRMDRQMDSAKEDRSSGGVVNRHDAVEKPAPEVESRIQRLQAKQQQLAQRMERLQLRHRELNRAIREKPDDQPSMHGAGRGE